MKKIFVALLCLPLLSFSQDKSGFSISGTISGFPDGTNVSFFNRETNKLDSITEIKNNTFFIQGGYLQEPEFRFLVFNKQQPVIPVLTQNDEIKITGSSNQLDRLEISGSALQADYRRLSDMLAPYSQVFESQNFTPENVSLITTACKKFIEENPSSYVSLLAVAQAFQLSHNPVEANGLLHKVDASLKNTKLSAALQQQIDVGELTAIGTPIKSFSQKDVDGKVVKISDFKGKYVLVDFWASWCRPCRMENPNVVANYKRFKDKDFTVLGVSLDESKASWLNAINADNLTWTHVSDLKGWQNEVSKMFNITSIPSNILIDPNGIIIARNVRGPELGKTLEGILGGK